MTVAVDTNILLDILLDTSSHRAASEEALLSAGQRGPLVIAEPVYAELTPVFQTERQLSAFLADAGLALASSTPRALQAAGIAWREYTRRRPRTVRCAQCGGSVPAICPSCGHAALPRQHLIADFMIGAHALEVAGELITRDRGFYRTYFPDLVINAG